MRRLALVLVALPALVLALAVGATAGTAGAATGEQAPTVTAIPSPTTDFSGVGTLDDGRPATECISANPRPDCDSASKADGRTLVLLGVLLVALGGIGFVVVRSVRRTDRARAEAADAPSRS